MEAEKLPRILLVDDHRDSVELTALLLNKRGYVVVPAYSVAGAQAAAAVQQCAVLITDGHLPDGSGVELMREMKSKYGMAGILVSGSIEDGDAVAEEGFTFLPKPLNLQKLLATLQSL